MVVTVFCRDFWRNSEENFAALGLHLNAPHVSHEALCARAEAEIQEAEERRRTRRRTGEGGSARGADAELEEEVGAFTGDSAVADL